MSDQIKRVSLIALALMVLISGSSYAGEIPQFLAKSAGESEIILKIADDSRVSMRKVILQDANLTLSEKRPMLEGLLKEQSSLAQSRLLDIIKSNPHSVTKYKSYWITNAIYVKGDSQFLRRLAAMDEVEGVFENSELVLVEPVFSSDAEDFAAAVQPGVEIIGARDVWGMGLTGEGTLVCNFDTGVDGGHPALASSWRGANGGSVSESWFDPYSGTDFPVDSRGHGTHTMGTILGFAGADTIGVAIGAEWIAAGVVDRGGNIDRTISDILSAFEWAADPDGNPLTSDDLPDVVNNSWGVPAGLYGPCDQTFWDAIDNLEAMGVVCLFAAGNEGPNPSTLRTPADRIASQFNSFAVGAIDGSAMAIASFSSRGPSSCDNMTIKPELTAPGVAIRSSVPGGAYAYKSGTSMAVPHVSGAVSILRQFNPEATVPQIKAALIQGAIDMGESGEDNDYGSGLLNIKNALYHLPPPGHPFLHVIDINIIDNENGIAEPGETVSLQIQIENLGTAGTIEANLESSSHGVNILDNYANLGEILHHDTSSSSAFALAISESMNIGESAELHVEFYSDSWNQQYAYILMIGGSSESSVATIATDVLEMSFSNFGQFGLGENSFNPSGGIGFRYPAGNIDFMKEASLFISSSGYVVDGARNSDNIPDNDFKPLPGGTARISSPGLYSDYDGYAAYSDSAAEHPIGLAITQKCFAWDLNTKFIIAEFTIENLTNEIIDDLKVGMYCDWDLAISSGVDDVVDYDDARALGYIEDYSSGWCIGVRSITDYPGSYRAIDNDQTFVDGFSDSEKLQFMNDEFDVISYSIPGDYSHILTTGPYVLNPGEAEIVAFALVVGESLNEIQMQADLAFDMYPQLTDISSSDDSNLPGSIQLFQNYPNPFNGKTSIGLIADRPANLVIYDILGKIIKSYDIKSSGYSEIIWDGKNDSGENVGSGIYLYRIEGIANSVSRKMAYMK